MMNLSLMDPAFLGSLGSERDPYFSNVSLLLHGNGTNGSTSIIDSSPTPKTITAVGNAQISTAQSRFGGASIAFDGNGDYLVPSSSNVADFGTGSFTIEAWIYPTELVTARCLLDARSEGHIDQAILQIDTDSKLKFGTAANLGLIASTTSISINTWYHIAVSRADNSLRLFVNGTAESTAINSTNFSQGTNRPTIGATGYFVGFSTFAGYIDELRITKGVARYTANFTPPTAPFPDA